MKLTWEIICIIFHPVTSNVAKVLVTSDCDTSDDPNQLVPGIAVSSDGSIIVTLDVPQDEAKAMPFFEPSSYTAMWTVVSGLCGFGGQGGFTPPPDIVVGEQCETGPNADPDNGCETWEFCQLEMGVCNNKLGIHNGVCNILPEVCIEIYMPVCGCDGNDYENNCKAWAAGTSVSRMGTCDESLPTTTMTPEIEPPEGDDGCPGEGGCRNPITGECEEGIEIGRAHV